ncbi:MAG: hypothetical protein QXD77_00875 [Candidatus Aenigmatarchaeota archaeon]
MTEQKKLDDLRLRIINTYEKKLEGCYSKLPSARGDDAKRLKEQIAEYETVISEEKAQFGHPPQAVYRATEFGYVFYPPLLTTEDQALEREIATSNAMTVLGYLTVDPENDGKGALRWELQEAYGLAVYYVSKGLRYLMENKRHISRMRKLMGFSEIGDNEDVSKKALVERKPFRQFFTEDLKRRDRDAYEIILDTLRYYGEVKLHSPDVKDVDGTKVLYLTSSHKDADLVYELVPARKYADRTTIMMISRPNRGSFETMLEMRQGSNRPRKVDQDEVREFIRETGRKKISEMLQKREMQHDSIKKIRRKVA